MTAPLDTFLDHAVWRNTHRARLIPLCEAAKVVSRAPGEVLFKQFHPADQFFLLLDGRVGHEANVADDGAAWGMGLMTWPWAALGWSGFLPPFRNGTTARAETEARLLAWRHEELATLFYADPLLAVGFFRIVLESVRRQFEAARQERLSASPEFALAELPGFSNAEADRYRFAPGAMSVLRRSAFFEQFDEHALERLAAGAKLSRCEKNADVAEQGAATGGLRVLAAGRAVSYFSTERGSGGHLERFRSIADSGAILTGLPTLDGDYLSEAKVVAASTCWFYELPAEHLERCVREDPEFGRSFMQRHLDRLAHLISAARPPRPSVGTEPEIAAVRSLLEHNQARIPVTSDLHKVPHLLAHRLTVGNALACLRTVRKTGRYQERAIARTCTDLLAGVKAELHFYRDVLAAYASVTDAEDMEPSALRALCDAGLARAFSHLHTEVRGLDRLPSSPGHIVILNHLACPDYYELPNGYHFSFDTAFVSVLLYERYGASPVRVVRASPGLEYGHHLFYGRLGHITVPTIDSGLEDASQEMLERLRRESAAALFECGGAALSRGENVMICPEGRSQRACDSPARFYSGAFRLALTADPEPLIVPIAVAGFDERYKSAKLVAVVQEPFRLSEAMSKGGFADLRAFLDDYRVRFAAAVEEARRISRGRRATGDTCAVH